MLGLLLLVFAPALFAQTTAAPGATRTRVHVVPFTFAADPQPYFQTKEWQTELNRRMDEVRQAFRDQSAGRVDVVFEWHPQVVINQPMVAGDVNTGIRWGQEAIAKAGLSATTDRIMLLERQVLFGQFATARVAFFLGTPGSIFHELSHTFGVRHSGTITCQLNGKAVTWAGDVARCALDEYGDRFSPMSSAGAPLPGAVLNSFQRLMAGFLPERALQVLPYGAEATVTLAPLGARTGVQMVRVPLRDQTNLPAVRHEYFDLEYNPVANGVLMYYGRCGTCMDAPTRLLDLTPGDQDFLNGGFKTGQSYTDSSTGITITLVSQGANQATLRVQFNAAGR